MNETKNDGWFGKRLVLPVLTVFAASFAVMVVEIAAARIVAAYLGTSLYTWTAVICAVLSGIAIGSYLGGFFSDRYPSSKLLALLFGIAAIACAFVPAANAWAGEWSLLWMMPVTARILAHVTIVFLLPSIILGMIAPAVTKYALDYNFGKGRTVGYMYAWSSAGSIAGTFLAGFFLIPMMGTIAIVWCVAGILAALSVYYTLVCLRPSASRIPILISALLAGFAVFACAQKDWVGSVARAAGVMKENPESVLYDAESPYSRIVVREFDRDPRYRKLILGQLLHSIVNIEDPADIHSLHQYPYIRVYAQATEQLVRENESVNALVIGGGGYVFPRYLRETYPAGRVDVAEIDPAVTKAARETLGLKDDARLVIYEEDGRTLVERLVRQKENGQYDFVYADAIHGLSAPFQLTTYEFNEKVKSLLSPDGVYMLTIIDNYRSGRFLAAMASTLAKSYPEVRVYAAEGLKDSDYARNTFVLLASRRALAEDDLNLAGLDAQRLSGDDLARLADRNNTQILTDNYAPVENLLQAAYLEREREIASVRFTSRGDVWAKKGNFEKAAVYFERALEINPQFAGAHNNLGSLLVKQGNLDAAKRHYEEAIDIEPYFAEAHINLATILAQENELLSSEQHYRKALQIDPTLIEAHYNLGAIYLGMSDFVKARECFEDALAKNPNFAPAHQALGSLYYQSGNKDKAFYHYEEALKLEPNSAQGHNNLGSLLAQAGEIKKALDHFRKAVRLDPNYELARQNLDKATEDLKKNRITG